MTTRHYGDISEVIDTEDHIMDVAHLLNALNTFHKERERTYQMSFAKRGLVGVWMNFGRKLDRVDELARRYFHTNDGYADREKLVDTLVDTAIYALKWLAILSRLEVQDGQDYGFKEWAIRTFAHEVCDGDKNLALEYLSRAYEMSIERGDGPNV